MKPGVFSQPSLHFVFLVGAVVIYDAMNI